MTTKKKLELPADLALLTREDREELTRTAKEHVSDLRKQKASDDYYTNEVERLQREHIPNEKIVSIVIDSAPYVPHFRIDDNIFFNGFEYRVPKSQADVLCEQMQRSWQHQDEIDGRSRYAPYRRAQGMKVGAYLAGTPTPGLGPGGVISADMD
jgi:hypothetical protein